MSDADELHEQDADEVPGEPWVLFTRVTFPDAPEMTEPVFVIAQFGPDRRPDLRRAQYVDELGARSLLHQVRTALSRLNVSRIEQALQDGERG